MRPMRFTHHFRRKHASTLAELLVTIGIVGFLGGAIYVMLNGGTVLYSKIFQMSAVQQTARSTMQAMSTRLYEAVQQPTLTDAGGNDLAAIDANGDGNPTLEENWTPSAGVKFRVTIGQAHRVTRDAGSTDNAIYVATASTAILAGDIVTIPYPKITAKASGVTVSGAETCLQFSKTLGELSLPPQVSAKASFVTADTPSTMDRLSSFVAVPLSGTSAAELRYYPRAMSAATDGTATFNDKANYRVVASNLRSDNGGGLPFSYTGDPTAPVLTRDPEYRTLRVNLQIKAREFDNRNNAAFNSNLAVNSAVAWKSAAHIQFASAVPIPLATPTPAPTPTPPPPPVVD